MRRDRGSKTASGAIGFFPGILISLVVGLGVGLLLQIGRERLSLGLLLPSAAVGLLIFLLIDLQLRLTRRWRAGLSGARHGAVLGAIFAVSGALAWLSVFTVWATAAGQRVVPGQLLMPILLAGGLAVVIGFLFYGYERLRGELSEKITRLKTAEFAERELELARAMQRRLLPPLKVDAGSYRLAARNRAAAWVAGDFYDVFALPDGRQAIAVGDVAGKGMATSLIMASVKAMLPLVAVGGSAADTLTALNERLVEDMGSREFVAVALALYRPDTGELEVANAGLPDPYLLRGDGAATPLETPGPRLPLGVRQGVAYEARSGRLEPGDRLLLLTDGLPEAQIGEDEVLGYEAFERLLPRGAGDPSELLGRLFRRLSLEAGDEPSDDWTAVLLERTGTEVSPGPEDPARASTSR